MSDTVKWKCRCGYEWIGDAGDCGHAALRARAEKAEREVEAFRFYSDEFCQRDETAEHAAYAMYDAVVAHRKRAEQAERERDEARVQDGIHCDGIETALAHADEANLRFTALRARVLALAEEWAKRGKFNEADALRKTLEGGGK